MKQYKKVERNIHGKLYIVPTPIGNLNDITQRALTVLQQVDLIAAEDVQHTNLLLQRFSISACSFTTLNSHNEQIKSKILITKLKEGKNIALVSNAGTPTINDPGRYLVNICRKFGIRVVPLPGPCAAITALSSSGLPSCRFCYEGFFPTKFNERRNLLKELETEPRTIIFYESTHRLLETLNDIKVFWGGSRYVVLARELTKIWETIHRASVSELLTWLKKDTKRCKGEIVLIIEGYNKIRRDPLSPNILHTFNLLRNEQFSLKRTAFLTAKIHNVKKNELYKYFLNQAKVSENT